MIAYYLRLLYTHDSTQMVSKAIHAVTGGPAHVAIEVTSVSEGEVFDVSYFESIWKKDKRLGKNGVRGPIPIQSLVDWAVEKPGRTLEMQPAVGYLPLTQDEALVAVLQLREARDVIHYATLQLVQNWMAAALRTRLSFGSGSPKTWTCCEVPVRTRVIPARYWGYLGMDHINADEIWPGGESIFSLRAGVERLLAAHPAIQLGQDEGDRDARTERSRVSRGEAAD